MIPNALTQQPHFHWSIRRQLILLAVHAAVFTTAYFLAFYIRNDFTVEARWVSTFKATAIGIVLIKLLIFYALGICDAPWRRIAFGDLTKLLWASTLALLTFFTLDNLFLATGWIAFIPRVRRSVILLDWAATILLLGGIRTAWRTVREELQPLFHLTARRRALVIGANSTGEVIAKFVQGVSDQPFYVDGFLDDDARLKHAQIAGRKVFGNIDDAERVISRRGIDHLFVQAGYLSHKRLRLLLEVCRETGATLKVFPGLDELLNQNKDLSRVQLRQVEIKDLLRRQPVELDESAIRDLVSGRVVMVTGAGGSIGSELCRQLLRFAPRNLLLVDRAENSMFIVEQEFSRLKPTTTFVPLIADIADELRMDQIMQFHHPEVVFHAAAYKHVPMMESNPTEAIKNNVFGTRLLARLADEHGVRQFVLISTDKAVNPTSVMGCSKLLAERFVQALSGTSDTKFIVVRFGNVLASNGSVVPTFQEQIRRGGPITVTHPDIKRFFMTIPEASQLVLQAAAMGSGGEIFVLDMGQSIRIVDLARDLIMLSGFSPDDIEIAFTGLRPGEKLHEELYFEDEERVTTSHAKVFCARHRPVDLPTIEKSLEELFDVVDEPADRVREKLCAIVPEFCSATINTPAIVSVGELDSVNKP